MEYDLEMFTPYMKDVEVTDISVPDSGEIVITRFKKGREFTGKIVPDYICGRIIKAAAAVNEKSLSLTSGFPILEGVIPVYNARITGLMRPTCIRPELQIRMPQRMDYPLEEYVSDGCLTQDQFDAIVNVIKAKGNMIIVGSTGSGKTTFANAVLQKMSELFPCDNHYIVEDTPELRCPARMKTSIWVDKQHSVAAVEAAQRFFPDRIHFGEVRTPQVLSALFDAWKTHSGGITTYHATSAEIALTRINSMRGTAVAAADPISEFVQLIVHLKRTANGVIVDEVCPVGSDEDNFLASLAQNNLV